VRKISTLLVRHGAAFSSQVFLDGFARHLSVAVQVEFESKL
jgi:hypothetical protein